ncbi:MAG TPA: peptidoglycan-binding domain-containing protein, partial [Myxococcaceae bacterium]|nr:peptidoglycan-binding domain-containing protein [Myxococcaceae bacterium]
LLYGISADALWNDERNGAVKQAVKSPFTLRPGDVLMIPTQEPKRVALATDRRHTFRRRGTLEKFSLTLTKGGKPRAGLTYELDVEGSKFEGKTDSEGKLTHELSPTAREGLLTLYADTDAEPVRYALRFGYLQPVETESGLRSRLSNLGFLRDHDADEDGGLRRALDAFQREAGLKMTGKPNAQTRQKLVEWHGS